jgi:hypothetical protein
VTCLRFSSRCTKTQFGSAYCRCPCFFPALRYIRAARTASVTSSPNGQVSPEVANRFSVSRTVDGTPRSAVRSGVWTPQHFPNEQSRAHGACKLSPLASIPSSATAKEAILNTASGEPRHPPQCRATISWNRWARISRNQWATIFRRRLSP